MHRDLGNVVGPPGPTGEAAGFGVPTAEIDSSIGIPQVTVSASGPDTAKVFSFSFKNLKGEPGPEGPPGKNGDNGLGAEEALAMLNGFSFGFTEDGQAGYKLAGADTVTPFKTGESGGGGSFSAGLEIIDETFNVIHADFLNCFECRFLEGEKVSETKGVEVV